MTNSTEQKNQLLYFPLRGRANLIRMVLHLGKIEYEPVIPDWPAAKDQQPFLQLPVWKEGDFVLSQSGAIVRYLASKSNLIPANDQERGLVDSVVDAWSEVRGKAVQVFLAKTDADKIAATKECLEFANQQAKCHEKLLKGRPGLFYVGDDLTIADLALFDVLFQCKKLDKNFINVLPERINKIYSSVESHFSDFLATETAYLDAPI